MAGRDSGRERVACNNFCVCTLALRRAVSNFILRRAVKLNQHRIIYLTSERTLYNIVALLDNPKYIQRDAD